MAGLSDFATLAFGLLGFFYVIYYNEISFGKSPILID